MTEIITECILGFIADHANLLDSFVMTYAGLISALYNVIGMELGAHLIQTAVERFDRLHKDVGVKKSAHAAGNGQEVEEDEVTSKKALNIATFITHLYNFDVVSYPLVYDIVHLCLDRLYEVDIEILLRMLRVSGSKMRTDNPLSLKEVVVKVHEGMQKGEGVYKT
jgi:nucleolar MIF4G domain-containing protein 1